MKETVDCPELVTLLQQAELLIDADRLPDALELYDQTLERYRPAIHLLQRRGWLRRLTGDLDGAISDYDNAIALSPDDADLYCNRGACLAHRMSNLPELDRSTRVKCLAQVIDNYHASVERDPGNASAWLALVEAHLLQHDWDAAIANYALCRPYINTDQYRLVRAWLGCLAMCLAGDAIDEEDEALMHDNRIKLQHTSWCVAEIDSLLDELGSDGCSNAMLVNALELHRLFLDHFIDKAIRRKATAE